MHKNRQIHYGVGHIPKDRIYIIALQSYKTSVTKGNVVSVLKGNGFFRESSDITFVHSIYHQFYRVSGINYTETVSTQSGIETLNPGLSDCRSLTCSDSD